MKNQKWRWLSCVGVVLVLWLVPASPALAHGGNDRRATNYLTTLKSFDGVGAGLKMDVLGSGERLRLRNPTPVEAVVLGYQDEPYLRISSAGVFANRNSAAVYVNRTLDGTTPIPPNLGPADPPVWEKVSDDDVLAWHDHRAHWMTDPPPEVRANPRAGFDVIPHWHVPVVYGGTTYMATGRVEYVPPPSSTPWIVIAIGAFVIGLVASVRPRWTVPALLLLLIIDIVHFWGIAFRDDGLTAVQRISLISSTGIASVLAWVAGFYAIFHLWRRSDTGRWFTWFSAIAIALLGGVTSVGEINKSQVPFLFSPPVAKFLIATSSGLGLGLTLAQFLLLRRIGAFAKPPEEAQDDETPVEEGEVGSLRSRDTDGTSEVPSEIGTEN